MSWIIKKLNNPLRTALVFSLFLHVIGLYFLTSLTFITKIRSPETAPIKVRPIIEKRIIKPLKVKSLKNGNITEKKVQGNRPLKVARTTKQEFQFLFSDPGSATFMDTNTYEQISINNEFLGDTLDFIEDLLQESI